MYAAVLKLQYVPLLVLTTCSTCPEYELCYRCSIDTYVSVCVYMYAHSSKYWKVIIQFSINILWVELNV